MKYANKSGKEKVLIIGSQEIEEGKFTFKSMISGEQNKLTIDELIQLLQ